MIKHASELTVAPQAFVGALTHASQKTADAVTPKPSAKFASSTSASLPLVQACLAHLDPDLPYPEWFRVAAAVFHTTVASEDGFALFDQWSSTGQKYKGKRDTRGVWKSLRLDHPKATTIATLRYLLEQAGSDWIDVCSEAEPDFVAAEEEGE